MPDAPYDEKHLHTLGRLETGIALNDRERFGDDKRAGFHF